MAFTPQAKAEKLLKELQKLPANKRCADCSGNGSLAPQYVCMNFGTFICTNCATAHRALNHRVKGISMSVFKEEEVAKLQAIGNEVARARYMPAFTGKLPDAEDAAAVKAFVHAVYVDKKFAAAAAPAPAQPGPPLPPRPSTAPSATSSSRASAFEAFAGVDDTAPPPVPPRKSHAVMSTTTGGGQLTGSPPLVPAPARQADPFAAAAAADPFASFAAAAPPAAPVAALTSAMGAWGGLGGGDPFAAAPASAASGSDVSRAASPAAGDSPIPAAVGLTPGAASGGPRTLSPAQGPGTPDALAPGVVPVPTQQPAGQQQRPSAARELPSDLFSEASPPQPQPNQGAYGAPPQYGAAPYGAQVPQYAYAPPPPQAPPPHQPAVPFASGAAPRRSTNPFDDVAPAAMSYYGSPPAAHAPGFAASGAGAGGWGAPQQHAHAHAPPPAAPGGWGGEPLGAAPPAFAAAASAAAPPPPEQPAAAVDPFASLGGF